MVELSMGGQPEFDFTTSEKQKKRMFIMDPDKAFIHFMLGEDVDYSDPKLQELASKMKAARLADSGINPAAGGQSSQ